jgi:hypothetical protein
MGIRLNDVKAEDLPEIFIPEDSRWRLLRRGGSTTLPAGLPRAIYAMFLVAEVHPFADGNGRVFELMDQTNALVDPRDVENSDVHLLDPPAR